MDKHPWYTCTFYNAEDDISRVVVQVLFASPQIWCEIGERNRCKKNVCFPTLCHKQLLVCMFRARVLTLGIFSPANEYINYLFPHMTSAAFTSALRRSRSSMNGRLASMNNCQHPLICFRTASVFGMAWLRLQITCECQHLEAVFIPQTTFSLRMLIWVVALTRILSATRTTVTINITHKYTRYPYYQ